MSDLWIFGYGSLMWRPGFSYEEAAPALLRGAQRALCVYSWVHRGTRWRPGLVLGLDSGGSCHGLAFRVAGARAAQVKSYLRRREQVTNVYRASLRRVHLLDGSGRTVRALCFLVDRSHRQYAGRLPVARQAWHVRRGRGRSGHNLDYLANTLRHLDEMGIVDRPLTRLRAQFAARRVLRSELSRPRAR